MTVRVHGWDWPLGGWDPNGFFPYGVHTLKAAYQSTTTLILNSRRHFVHTHSDKDDAEARMESRRNMYKQPM